MQKTKSDKAVDTVDIDNKINSIETSIKDIKLLLAGFQTTSYKHVNPETLKDTLRTVLQSLQSPLSQISSFLEEVNATKPAPITKQPSLPQLKKEDEVKATKEVKETKVEVKDVKEAKTEETAPASNVADSLKELENLTPSANDLLAQLEGGATGLDFPSTNNVDLGELSASLHELETTRQNNTADLSAALKDLEEPAPPSTNLSDLLASLNATEETPAPATGSNFDDLNAALSGLSKHDTSKSDFDDLNAALSGLKQASSSEINDALADLNVQGDDISFSLNKRVASSKVIKRSDRKKLSKMNFDAMSFEDEALSEFPSKSLKKKQSPALEVPLDDLLKNLDSCATSSEELTNALSTLSSLDTADALKDLQFDSAATQAALADLDFGSSNVDSIAESLRELEQPTPASLDWMKVFSGPGAGDEPSKEKRRTSRIGRSAPIPQREAGKLIRGYGVREDINKPGLRRVKKGKGIHASGKAVLQMEDVNVVVHPFDSDHNKAIFCVFDGHVGKDCAQQAKELWPEEFKKQLALCPEDNPTQAFEKSYANVDQKLSSFEYEGTTATTVYLWQIGEDRYVQAANVGDSTAFLCRNGEAIWLTKDHKVTDPEEQERLKELGPNAWHPGKSRINGLAVSRAMGDFFVKNEGLGLVGTPYISNVIKLEPDDSFMIVASDGLWDVMTGQGAMNLVKNMDDAEEMAKTLIRHALQSPKCNDNITIIVVTL